MDRGRKYKRSSRTLETQLGGEHLSTVPPKQFSHHLSPGAVPPSAVPCVRSLKEPTRQSTQPLLALLSSLASLVFLVPCLFPALCLPACLPLSRPHSNRAFCSFTSPPCNPRALTLLYMACLLSGVPWQGPPNGTHFTFIFKSFHKALGSSPAHRAGVEVGEWRA